MITMNLHICWGNLSVLWSWFPWKTPLIGSSLMPGRWKTKMMTTLDKHERTHRKSTWESLAKNNPKSWTAIHPLPHLVGNQSHHICTTLEPKAGQWHGCSNGTLATKKPAVALEDSVGFWWIFGPPKMLGIHPGFGYRKLLNLFSIFWMMIREVPVFETWTSGFSCEEVFRQGPSDFELVCWLAKGSWIWLGKNFTT